MSGGSWGLSLLEVVVFSLIGLSMLVLICLIAFLIASGFGKYKDKPLGQDAITADSAPASTNAERD